MGREIREAGLMTKVRRNHGSRELNQARRLAQTAIHVNRGKRSGPEDRRLASMQRQTASDPLLVYRSPASRAWHSLASGHEPPPDTSRQTRRLCPDGVNALSST